MKYFNQTAQMNNQLIQKPLIVKKSSLHGYGVFAGKDFQCNEMIEECYTLTAESQELDLKDYYFAAGDKSGLPLGFGAIYNHADEPNVAYHYVQDLKLLVFQAKRFIHQGEELLINYGDDWFGCRQLRIKKSPFLKRALTYLRGMPFRALFVISCVFLIIKLLTLAQLP